MNIDTNETKKFDEIYDYIYNKNGNKLKKIKSKNNNIIHFFLIVCIIVNCIIYFVIEAKFIVVGTVTLSFCIMLVVMIVIRKGYGTLYKKYIIEELVKQYNNKFYYNSSVGITQAEYRMSEFDNTFNKYHSEDRIYGNFENGANIQIAEVATYIRQESVDVNGNKTVSEKETYRGMYGIVRLPKEVPTSIYISEDSKFNRFSKSRIEVDSAEFEQYFDCSARNKIIAMRIFTADLIEKYVDIMRKYKYKLQMKIEYDRIFFRYKTGCLFEPPTFGNDLDRQTVKKYYDMIVGPLELINKTVENINQL